MEVFRIFAGFRGGRQGGGNEDDGIDRLSHKYTRIILIIFAITVSTKQYVGDPIECWCPAQFTENYIQFTHRTCWVHNTYFIPVGEQIPKRDDLKPQITYYQWTPFILLIQALLCYLPHMIWSTLSSRAGISIRSCVEAGNSYIRTTKFEDRDRMIKYVTMHLDQYFEVRRPRVREETCGRCCNKHLRSLRESCICGRHYGNYLIIVHLIVKILFIGNIVLQIMVLNVLLGMDFHLYGFDVIKGLREDGLTNDSTYFPRVTLCDFHVRNFGQNIHRYTVECVLSINLFNEKIFSFIWFWLAFVGVLSVLNFFVSVIRTLIPTDGYRYVKRHLKATRNIKNERDKRECRRFVNKYIRQDGIFVLKMISRNSTDIVVTEVLHALWENYNDLKEHEEPEEEEATFLGPRRPTRPPPSAPTRNHKPPRTGSR